MFLPILVLLSFKVMLFLFVCLFEFFLFSSPKMVLYQRYQHERFAGVSTSLKTKETTPNPQSPDRVFSLSLCLSSQRGTISPFLLRLISLSDQIHNALSPREFLTVHVQVDKKCANPALGMGPTRSWTSFTTPFRVAGSALQHNGFQLIPKMKEKG